MKNLRNQRGSITLFVLVSCMFFIASVTCVQIYIQSKQTAVDREYRQIKSNYEGDTLSETNLREQYTKLSNLKNADITITKVAKSGNNLMVEFKLSSTDIDVKTIKYGWGTGTTVDTVSNWNFIENSGAKGNMIALNREAESDESYNLFVVVNDKVLYSKIDAPT